MSTNPAIRTTVALCLAAAPLACAPPSVYSDRDEAIAIPHGASWAWAAPDTSSAWQRDPILFNEITNQRYVRAIDAAMEAKGFHKAASADEADFLLTYHMGSPHYGQTHATSVAMVGFGVGGGGWGWGRPGYGGYGGYGYGYGWPGWGWGLYGPPMYAGMAVAGPGAVPYHDGALFLLLRQRESGNVAWEVRYALDPYESQKVSQQRVQEIVNKLFAELQ